MQKIGNEPKTEAQSMNTDGIPSIQRIPLTRAQASLYVSARMIDTVVRQYDAGDTYARVKCSHA